MRTGPIAITSATFVIAFAASAQAPAPRATPRDLRALHERVVYATVLVSTPHIAATGWLLAQRGRPLVITNAHVANSIGLQGRATVSFYAGSEDAPIDVQATRIYVSSSIDLAILRLDGDAPASARPLTLRTTTTVVRGERVVLGGNPSTGQGGVLPFQTTEGVVTGQIARRDYAQCGANRNCIVVDAASFAGSSGGPALNVDGAIVGMLWGGPVQSTSVRTPIVGQTPQGQVVTGVLEGAGVVVNPSFGYLIHTRTIAAELRTLEVSRPGTSPGGDAGRP